DATESTRIMDCGLRIADCGLMILSNRRRNIEVESCVNPQSSISNGRNPQSITGFDNGLEGRLL
ncbi:MAG TPA: hypothetical protein VI479_21885, partial [Blastocatellia bacterium]